MLVTAVSVNHTVPAVGFIIERADVSVVFSGAGLFAGLALVRSFT